MQRIARELNLSETVFVRPPTAAGATHRMRIFTPGMELPFAGHPTIGTAALLASLQTGGSPTADFVFEQGAGLVPTTVQRSGAGLWEARLTAPRLPAHGPAAPARQGLARLIGLPLEELLDGEAGAQAISAGVPFLLIPLRSVDALERARLDTAHWKALLAEFWAPHVYCFALDQAAGMQAIRARMFAPAMGIEEDPETGAGAVALAGYLHAVHPARESPVTWTVTQGLQIGRPSLLLLELTHAGGALNAVRLGGTSVVMGSGALRFPDDGQSA